MQSYVSISKVSLDFVRGAVKANRTKTSLTDVLFCENSELSPAQLATFFQTSLDFMVEFWQVEMSEIIVTAHDSLLGE